MQKLTEINFIGDDELWIGVKRYGYKIVEFWGDTIIWHGQGILHRLHLKVVHGFNSMCM